MAKEVKPHLMFEGDARSAMELYLSVFPNSEIISAEYYGQGEQGAEGSVKTAVFSLEGQKFICIDSPAHHDFTFTPSMSIFVDCDDEAELQRAFDTLGEDGKVFMPLDNYGFSKRFGWISDRFGVSWQLNLP
jgi:predicted 3-demethylubiquinone-9 3-methyltransferase (glyoxalase superfamily)